MTNKEKFLFLISDHPLVTRFMKTEKMSIRLKKASDNLNFSEFGLLEKIGPNTIESYHFLNFFSRWIIQSWKLYSRISFDRLIETLRKWPIVVFRSSWIKRNWFHVFISESRFLEHVGMWECFIEKTPVLSLPSKRADAAIIGSGALCRFVSFLHWTFFSDWEES